MQHFDLFSFEKGAALNNFTELLYIYSAIRNDSTNTIVPYIPLT